MGVLLVITGILFLTGSINMFGFWMLENFPGLAELEKCLLPVEFQGDIVGQPSP